MSINYSDLLDINQKKNCIINSRSNSFSVNSHFKKLKSSLKLSSRTNSTNSNVSSELSSSHNKNVRFAAELTTVKNFCSTDKPSSISNENSPNLIPLDESYQSFINNSNSNLNSNAWFNDSTTLQILFNEKQKTFGNFQLDYDSDSGLDDDYDDDNENNNNNNNNHNINININDDSMINSLISNKREEYFASFDIIDWNLIDSNLHTKDSSLFLNYGQNIKLYSVEQKIDEKNNMKTDEIVGLIYVNNLNFEKSIEIKFTFTNWRDIHYITANFNKSITNEIDEFNFTINLSSFKYFLKLENLICTNTNSNLPTFSPLKIQFCCRYDVNNETYYDNNNYKNYELSIMVETKNFNPIHMTKKKYHLKDNKIKNIKESKKSFYSDFLVSTTLSHKIHLMNNNFNNSNSEKKNLTTSRRFSEDTDYYNTSPLKHLYHNDTTLIKPTSLNEVLTSVAEKSNLNENQGFINNYDDPTIHNYTFQQYQYTSTPSLSSSLSSSLSDLSPLPEYADILRKNEVVLGPFNYNTNYNFADAFSKSFNNNNLDEKYLDFQNNNDKNVDPLTIAASNNDFSDDRQSIITDTPQDIYANNIYLNDNDLQFTNINNSIETLINPNKIENPNNEERILLPHVSTLRSDNASSISSARLTSSELESCLSPSSELENKDNCNLNSRVTNTIATSSFSGIAETFKPRDLDYKTILNSYCFFTSDIEATPHKSYF